jgi:hypothetical protein
MDLFTKLKVFAAKLPLIGGLLVPFRYNLVIFYPDGDTGRIKFGRFDKARLVKSSGKSFMWIKGSGDFIDSIPFESIDLQRNIIPLVQTGRGHYSAVRKFIASVEEGGDFASVLAETAKDDLYSGAFVSQVSQDNERMPVNMGFVILAGLGAIVVVALAMGLLSYFNVGAMQSQVTCACGPVLNYSTGVPVV